MNYEKESKKVKNGIKVFTRMADNARVTALAVVDTMKAMRKENHIIDELIPMVDRIMASSSNNFIFSDSVFKDSENAPEPIVATRVLEIYIRWKKGYKFTSDFLISLSADVGSNTVNFAIGWDGDEEVTKWTEYTYRAMNDVIMTVIEDMDNFIEEEINNTRRMSYENIIMNEINKKIAAHAKTNPDDLEVTWSETAKTAIEDAACTINKISKDVVSIYPVEDFIISCSDNEGVPLFKIATKILDPDSKSPDTNFAMYVSFFDNASYSDYKKIQPDSMNLVLGDTNNCRCLNAIMNVFVPAISRVIPDLSTLQTAIINQTVEKIGKESEKSQ